VQSLLELPRRQSFGIFDRLIFVGLWVRLSEHSLRLSHSHYAVYPTSSESNPALVAFRDWLIEEARRT